MLGMRAALLLLHAVSAAAFAPPFPAKRLVDTAAAALDTFAGPTNCKYEKHHFAALTSSRFHEVNFICDQGHFRVDLHDKVPGEYTITEIDVAISVAAIPADVLKEASKHVDVEACEAIIYSYDFDVKGAGFPAVLMTEHTLSGCNGVGNNNGEKGMLCVFETAKSAEEGGCWSQEEVSAWDTRFKAGL